MKISKSDARKFILGQQGLWPGRRFSGVDGAEAAIRVCEHLQLDPLNMVGRAHDLILLSRVVDYRPQMLQDLAYKERKFFDWGNWLAMRPMEEFPHWRAIMKTTVKHPAYQAWLKDHAGAIKQVVKELETRGPLGNRDFVGGKKVVSYRGGKDTSLALYYLWIQGEVMTYSRRNFERVYDLKKNVLPPHLDTVSSPKEAELFFAKKLIAFHGIGGLDNMNIWIETRDFKANAARIEKSLLKSEILVPVEVEGEKKKKFILAQDLSKLEAIQRGDVPKEWSGLLTDNEKEIIFLSPLDIVSARGRAKKIFDFDYIWEVYKPLELRRWGYYVLPILWKDKLVGRADLKLNRQKGRFEVLGFWLEDPKTATEKNFSTAMRAGIERMMKFLEVAELKVSGPGSATLKKDFKMKKPIPFDFVLAELSSLQPYIKPMFGCTAVYVENRIVFILRDRPEPAADRGVWAGDDRRASC